MYERDLSPESSRFVAPPPPRGTKRRPPKSPIDLTNTSGTMNPQFDSNACSTHLSTLAPHNLNLPLLDLTFRWLNDPSSALPSSTDVCVYRYMHKNNKYFRDVEDHKLVSLIDELRKNAEIEILDVVQYKALERKVEDRVQHLSDYLIRHGLIQNSDGSCKKSNEFMDAYEEQLRIWEDPMPSRISNAAAGHENEWEDPFSDHDNVSGTISNWTLPPKVTSVAAKSKTTPKRKRKVDSTVVVKPSAGVSTSAKRRKTLKSSLVSEPDTSPVITSSLQHSLSTVKKTTKDVAANLGMGGIHIDEEEETVWQRCSMSPDLEPSTWEIRPLLPAPSTPEPQIVSAPSATPPPTISPKPIQTEETSILPPPTPSQTLTRPTHLLTPSLLQPSIQLNFNNHHNAWTPRNQVPESSITHLPLPAFFALVAKQTNFPLEEIECLTFNLAFVPDVLDVDFIHKDDGEERWEEVKADMQKRFQFARLKFRGRRCFEVWVDVGDTREGVEKEESV